MIKMQTLKAIIMDGPRVSKWYSDGEGRRGSTGKPCDGLTVCGAFFEVEISTYLAIQKSFEVAGGAPNKAEPVMWRFGFERNSFAQEQKCKIA
jgi:hypothetical protein